MIDKQSAAKKIIEYYEQVLKKNQGTFCPNEEADSLVRENPVAFIFAVILDQGAQAERIWEMPYHLKQIMGNLDVNKIAVLSDQDIYMVFEKLPSKPRYWKTAARRIRNVSRQIVERYDGNAENIWNDNPKAGDLQSRFDNFDGISQKKASMATRILGMDLNKPIRNWSEIDVSVDVMIKRVFIRAGLSFTEDVQDIVDSARKLNPSFPGVLDLPCWDIGRRWCSPQQPDCVHCYIGQVCPKIGV